jgi:hypothetical protein
MKHFSSNHLSIVLHPVSKIIECSFFSLLLYNSLQSVANQAIVNSIIQHFKVIYLDVRSLIVGDLVENQITLIKTLILHF